MKLKDIGLPKEKRYWWLDDNDVGYNTALSEIGEIEIELDWKKMLKIMSDTYKKTCLMSSIAKAIANNLHHIIRRKNATSIH